MHFPKQKRRECIRSGIRQVMYLPLHTRRFEIVILVTIGMLTYTHYRKNSINFLKAIIRCAIKSLNLVHHRSAAPGGRRSWHEGNPGAYSLKQEQATKRNHCMRSESRRCLQTTKLWQSYSHSLTCPLTNAPHSATCILDLSWRGCQVDAKCGVRLDRLRAPRQQRLTTRVPFQLSLQIGIIGVTHLHKVAVGGVFFTKFEIFVLVLSSDLIGERWLGRC